MGAFWRAFASVVFEKGDRAGWNLCIYTTVKEDLEPLLEATRFFIQQLSSL